MTRTSTRARDDGASGLDHSLSYDVLLAAYERMVLLRRFDEEALRLRLDGEIHGPVHPYTGQEAVAVGVVTALERTDLVLSNHRGHGHCLAKGAAPDRMMAELYGRATGFCAGKGGSMHVTDVASGVLGADGIVGANTAMTVGVALQSKLANSGAVCVCFFGDGATGQGLIYESMNIASLWALPMIFVCENNGWAAETPTSMALAAHSITDVASAFGLRTAQADGNDVIDVFSKVGPLVEHARSGKGPALIECSTYRRGAHAQRGAAVPDRRPTEAAAEWVSRDPLDVAAHHLAQHPNSRDDEVAGARASAEAAIAAAIEFARTSPWPDPSTALTQVWADDIETGF